MSIRELLRELLPHALWRSVEWVGEHVLVPLVPVTMVIVVGMYQWLRSRPVDVWLLIIVCVVSFVGLLYADVRSRRRRVVAALPVVNTGGSQKTVPAVGLAIEKSWLEPAPGATYKLKLRVIWTNEGDSLHIGKPRWIPEGIDVQGDRLVCLFYPEEGGQETAEIDVRPGQRFYAWLGLSPAVGISEVERLRAARRLGVIAFPVRSSGKDIELRIRP